MRTVELCLNQQGKVARHFPVVLLQTSADTRKGEDEMKMKRFVSPVGENQLPNLTCSLRLITVALVLTLIVSSVFAKDLSTSFEFNDKSGEFTLGEPPNRVTFRDGETKLIGVRIIYHSGTRAFMVDVGKTATITFETPAAQVTLFLRDQRASVKSVLTVFGTSNEVIATFNGNVTDWTEVSIAADSGTALVGSVTLQNSGTSGYTVIDDFSFTAAAQQGDELENKLYFAQFADGAGLFSQIILFNLDRMMESTTRIILTDDNGQPLSVDLNGQLIEGQLQVTVPPSGSRSFRTDGVGPLIAGSVTVASDQPLGGVILFGGGIGLAGVGSSAELPDGFIAPMEVSETAGVNTGLAVMNLEQTEVSLDLRLLDSNGNSLATANATLLARGHMALFVDQFDWNGSIDFSSFQGILEIVASGKTAATVIQSRPGQFATLPVAQR
ncbi:hypothetical protein MYX75_12030 [Acidobacteria bacterium AH-259-A15]|nr:hypothetical protein [Acidobacteria bacterium AH-259-A15]